MHEVIEHVTGLQLILKAVSISGNQKPNSRIGLVVETLVNITFVEQKLFGDKSLTLEFKLTMQLAYLGLKYK